MGVADSSWSEWDRCTREFQTEPKGHSWAGADGRSEEAVDC